MVFKIKNIEENLLAARKQVSAHMTFEGKATPSNDDVKKAIANEMKVDGGLVIVKHIYTSFGSSEAEIEAYVYNTSEDLKRMEPMMKKKEEKKPEGEAPAEEKPAEEAKPKEKKEEAAEKPVQKEEKPEEKKEEVKEKKTEEKKEAK